MDEPLYGLIAEFDDPKALVEATARARAAGYRRMDAYSPIPLEELSEAMGIHSTAMPLLVLVGGIVGGVTGYALQYWVSAVAYPVNVGGRPYHSWPSFIPVTFELTILFAALTAVFGMIVLNGLPRLYHPVFNAQRFALATRDRFFLCIEARDPKFDLGGTRKFLEACAPREVSEVAR